jgi:predicted pyridoxine 5'-phosphate oxidase superfamily flavin-nucleotide-binding protein
MVREQMVVLGVLVRQHRFLALRFLMLGAAVVGAEQILELQLLGAGLPLVAAAALTEQLVLTIKARAGAGPQMVALAEMADLELSLLNILTL